MNKYSKMSKMSKYGSIFEVLLKNLGCPILSDHVLSKIKEQEFLDAQQEHIKMRSFEHKNASVPHSVPVPISPTKWRLSKDLFLDIQCIYEGFLYLIDYREEPDQSDIWLLNGVKEIDLLDKLMILKRLNYLCKDDDSGYKKTDVRISIKGYFREKEGFKGTHDYGGIYLEDQGESRGDMDITIL